MSIRGKCFVIMGYGVKTDIATGRELNLDKTYKNIIKPAVREANLECIRADEIRHSGTIDSPMYKQLLEADVVIADLSTYNANTFYELGVRHALRPKTTIAIAESELKPPFDINHTLIHQYEHLGKDIGCDEAERFKKELVETINAILETEDIDSPVYTYLKELKPPQLGSYEKELEETNNKRETLGSIIEQATEALNNDNFILAKTLLEQAYSIKPNDSYILQKLVLATYKSKYPSHIEALNEALSILEVLGIENTTDPETLGLAGAIFKRKHEECGNCEDLNNAIKYYEKGFYIRNDYYNGINTAYLLDVRASLEVEENDSITDHTLANRIRRSVITICEDLYKSECFKDRSDQYWIVATLEEAYFALGLSDIYNEYKKVSTSLSKENWERETTEQQIDKLKKVLLI